MQKGILITDQFGKIIEKNVLAGDLTDDTLASYVEKYQSAYPNATIQLVDDTEKVFVDASVISKDQSDWLIVKAKGPDAALSYIGKKLGFE